MRLKLFYSCSKEEILSFHRIGLFEYNDPPNMPFLPGCLSRGLVCPIFRGSRRSSLPGRRGRTARLLRLLPKVRSIARGATRARGTGRAYLTWRGRPWRTLIHAQTVVVHRTAADLATDRSNMFRALVSSSTGAATK